MKARCRRARRAVTVEEGAPTARTASPCLHTKSKAFRWSNHGTGTALLAPPCGHQMLCRMAQHTASRARHETDGWGLGERLLHLLQASRLCGYSRNEAHTDSYDLGHEYKRTLAALQAREYGAVMANTSSPLWTA